MRMEPKRLKRSTNVQLRLLIDYMSIHKDFAGSNGEYAGPIGARKSNEIWEKLQKALNIHGSEKSIEQWKQTWRDIKRKARKESADMLASGNRCTISDTMRKVLTTIGYTVIDDNEAESPQDLKDQSWDNIPIVPDHDPLSSTSPDRAGNVEEQASPIPEETPEKIVNVLSPKTTHRYQRVKRRRRRIPSEATTDLLARSHQNALLLRLCNLVEEQNSILREQNRLERRRAKYNNRYRRL